VLFQHGGRRTSYSARLYKFSRFMLLHTQIPFVPSDKINLVNVYYNKLVINLHIITLYKLHNKVASRDCCARRVERVEPVELVVSSVSSHAVQQARHSQNACMGSTRRACRVVSCRDVTSQVEFGLYHPLPITIAYSSSTYSN